MKNFICLLSILFLIPLSSYAEEDIFISPEDMEGIDNFEEFTSKPKSLPLQESVIIQEKDIDNLLKKEANEEVKLSKGNLRNLQDYNPDIDNKIINQLASEKEKLLSEVMQEVSKNEETRYNIKELQAYKIQLQDIMNSPIKLYQIHRGTKLIRLSDNKIIYIPKSIFVKAHAATDGYHNKYIINKAGKPIYRVHFDKLSDISKITNLYRPPFKTKSYKKDIIVNKYDSTFDYLFEFKTQYGFSSSNYFNDLLENIDGFQTTTLLEVSLFNAKRYFVTTGLSLYFQNTSGQFSSPAQGNFNIKTFSIGPSFKSSDFWGQTKIVFQPKISLFSTLNFTKDELQREVDMVENSLSLGIERTTPFFQFGSFLYGVRYQRSWYQADAQNIVMNFEKGSDFEDSFGFFIGHQSKW